MKKKRYLIISLIILFGLSLLYIGLEISSDKEMDDISTNESISVLDSDNISSIKVKPEGKEAYKIHFEIGDDGNKFFRIDGYDNSFSFDKLSIIKLISSVVNMHASDVMDDYGYDYGLDDEATSVIVKYSNGEKTTLVFGDETVVDGKVYMGDEEKKKTYIVKKNVKDMVDRSIYYFRIPRILPNVFRISENYVFAEMEISKVDGSSILVRPQSEDEKKVGISDEPSIYVIEKPVFWEGSDGKIDAMIITPIISLENEAVVVKDFPDDLFTYGITKDSPYIRLVMGDRICKIYFGSEKEDGDIYLFVEGGRSIYKVPKTSILWMNMEWTDIMNRGIWMRSIDKVDSILIKEKDKDYTVKLIRDEDLKITGGFLNEKLIDESSIRDIYMKLLSIHINEKSLLDTDKIIPDYEIVINMLDDTKESIELTYMDIRQYNVSINGKPLGFYTDYSSIRNLINYLRELE